MNAHAGLRADRLTATVDFIEQHLHETVSVGQLGQAAGLSPFHFSRMFLRSTGQTPHGYLTQRRMERARGLLAEGTLSLGDIATNCGYATQAHFTSVFRDHAGIPPGAYRTKVRTAPAAVEALATAG